MKFLYLNHTLMDTAIYFLLLIHWLTQIDLSFFIRFIKRKMLWRTNAGNRW